MKKSLVFKVFSMIAIIAMITSTLVSCTPAPTSTAATNSAIAPQSTMEAAPAGMDAYADFAKYSPEITLSPGWYESPTVVYGDGENMQNNRMITLFKDKLGINIKYAWVTSSEQYAEKVNVVTASGDIPDIMQVNSVQLAKLVDADLVKQDLQPVFDKYMSPTQVADYNNIGKEYNFGAATFNGKLCAIPLSYSATGQGARSLQIRTDWMKKLNLGAPQTFDDLVAMMTAFCNADFDGDGKKDTVGFSLNNNLYNLQPLFWCFHAYPNAWIKDASGKIVYGSAQPEIKTALAKFAEMYKNGLIDQEFAAKDRAKAAELFSSNQCGIEVELCHPGEASAYMASNPDADFGSYALPSADGKPVMYYFPSFGNVYIAIRKDYQYPEAVCKLYSYDTEMGYGPGATYENYVHLNQDTKTGQSPFTWGPWFNMSVEKNHRTFEKLVNKVPYDQLNGEERWISDQITALNKGERTAWWMARFFEPIPTCHYYVLDKILADKAYILDEFYGAPLPSMVANQAQVDKIFSQMVTKIIMGQDTIDNFDKYVADMNNAGLAQMTADVNAWAAQR